jgi:DNA-binding transcriptional MerR regulator
MIKERPNMKKDASHPTHYRTSQLAERAGVHPETLRYYLKEGLLTEPERTGSGYRLYTEADLQQLKLIKRAQALGFTLEDIRHLLSLRAALHHTTHSQKPTAQDLKNLALEKVALMEEKIAQLQEMKTALMQLIECCPGESLDLEECPILLDLTQANCQQKTCQPKES